MSHSALTVSSSSPFAPQLSDRDKAFLESASKFIQAEVEPFSLAWDQAGDFPADIWGKLGKAGLLGMTVPEEYGGSNISASAYCEACRLLASADAALGMNVAAINALAQGHIVTYGTDGQKEKYLRATTKGEIVLAWALTEPEAGSDARRVKTTASPHPDREGWFKATGEKMFITNGGWADLFILIAAKGDEGLSAFLMEKDQPGFEMIGRIPTVGVKASWTSHFRLKEADVWHTPCRFEEAIGLLYKGRLGIAAMALGIAEKAHSLALAYSRKREQFNRRLCDMQSVQNMLADTEVDLEAARLMLAKGAWMMDQGLPVIKESSMAKLFASEAANRATNRAIQIHGGRGMVPEHQVEKLWRDAKLTEIGEGCSEIQRMVISKQITR